MDLLFRGLTDVDTTGARRVLVTEPASAPCRRCLVDVEPGETALLVRHDPFPAGPDSAYRQAGPVFVHEHACAPAVSAQVPEQQRTRLLSVRSFDDAATMLEADVVDGADLETLLHRLLGRPEAAYVHVHNARPGCYAVRVERG